LGLSASVNEWTSLVKKAFDFDLNALTGRTAVTDARGKESACLLFSARFDTPFLYPRHQHPGVEQAGFCIGCGLRGDSGHA
jgi:hypothetical protein